MAIITRPITSADLPACADVCDNAFANDELFSKLYPRYKEYPSELRSWWLTRLKIRLLEPRSVGQVAVDEETGDVVGFAFWIREGDDEEAMRRVKQDTIWKKFERMLGWAELRYQTFFDHTDKAFFKRFQTEKYDYLENLNAHWYLINLAVSKNYQRRGIGTKLLSWGLETAKQEGLPVALEASVVGRVLYQKAGFQIRERKKMMEGMEDGVAMSWEPDDR